MWKRNNEWNTFNYVDKTLLILSAASGSVFIVSFATVIGTPVGIVSANFALGFSISTGVVQKFLKTR